MGLITVVKRVVKRVRNKGNTLTATCGVGGTAVVTAETFGPVGTDAHPLPNDVGVLVDLPHSGGYALVGFSDTVNERQAEPGEHIVYGRAADGTIVNRVWLKSDGSVHVSNDDGSIKLASDGSVTINGVVFDIDGNVFTNGDVVGAGVSLSTHVHGGVSSGGSSTSPPSVL
jgi:hypothetical protein